MIEPGSVMAGLGLGGGGPPEMSEDDHAVAASLMMLANSHGQRVNSFDHERENYYKCLSCRKVFSSHQALGGHRASHKNIKGCCFANNATGTATARVSSNSTLGRIKINEFAECEEGCSGASSSMATQLVLNSFAKKP
ncbi:hypothetical protein SAY86_019785 [Trapa natans]|uniref:C2H2-type domain-containing protein n=1 Tax=Trapa natans TaxID=22666 RepID=A0AAN7M1F5_TRANT|nr:hypothetical protein SAY86_019785 [Trapa natans]